jgi:small subunit ribosomal protein S21
MSLNYTAAAFYALVARSSDHIPMIRKGGDQLMPGVRVKDGESFESALRRFKKKCEKAGILSDLRKHQHFEKPSERRKRKENAARRKALQRQRGR